MTETHIREAITGGVIEGSYAPEFKGVYQAFRHNFEESGEQGAAICVSVRGETVVDLWGGVADQKTATPWQSDTLAVVFSCTKAATALAAHLLADRGALDLDAPVASIWPEFAAAGKEGITTRMLLDHTAGLPVLRAPLKRDCLLDWDYMTSHLAAERPFWEPGTRSGYHAITFGYLVGEVVLRFSGQSLGAFFQEEIARPLGIDFWIGLPESEEPRVAPITPYRFNKDDEEPPFIQCGADQRLHRQPVHFQSRRLDGPRCQHARRTRCGDRGCGRHNQRAWALWNVRGAADARWPTWPFRQDAGWLF